MSRLFLDSQCSGIAKVSICPLWPQVFFQLLRCPSSDLGVVNTKPHWQRHLQDMGLGCLALRFALRSSPWSVQQITACPKQNEHKEQNRMCVMPHLKLSPLTHCSPVLMNGGVYHDSVFRNLLFGAFGNAVLETRFLVSQANALGTLQCTSMYCISWPCSWEPGA